MRETIPDADKRVVLIDRLGFGHANVVVAVPQAWIDVRTMADLDDVATRSRSLSQRLGAARRGRRRDRARRRALDRLHAARSRPRTAGDGRTPTSGPSYKDDEIEASWTLAKLPTAGSRRSRRRDGAAARRRAASSAGSRAAWSSARARSARARSSPRRPTEDAGRASTKIKDREDFRPVAPVVLRRGRAGVVRLAPASRRSCCFVYDVRRRAGRPHPGGAPRRRHRPHPDGHAREQNPRYYDLLRSVRALHRRAGAGQHLVQHAGRADRLHAARRDGSFWTSPLDALVIGSFLVEKPGP